MDDTKKSLQIQDFKANQIIGLVSSKAGDSWSDAGSVQAVTMTTEQERLAGERASGLCTCMCGGMALRTRQRKEAVPPYGTVAFSGWGATSSGFSRVWSVGIQTHAWISTREHCTHKPVWSAPRGGCTLYIAVTSVGRTPRWCWRGVGNGSRVSCAPQHSLQANFTTSSNHVHWGLIKLM